MKNSILLLLFSLLIFGCTNREWDLPEPPPAPPPVKKIEDYDNIRNRTYRARRSPPIGQNRYRGSLWKNDASWGNFMRDHRARYRGDLVKITALQDVISVSKPEVSATPKPTGIAAVGEQVAGQIGQVMDAASGMTGAEEEQNEVLGSLRSISAYVENVLPNGNLIIVGKKVDYRQQNNIRYVTTIRGIIRPADVDNNNEVTAVKLAQFEPIIKRQMLRKSVGALAPLIGQKKASVFDRLSHMATPKPKARTVRTK